MIDEAWLRDNGMEPFATLHIEPPYPVVIVKMPRISLDATIEDLMQLRPGQIVRVSEYDSIAFLRLPETRGIEDPTLLTVLMDAYQARPGK